MEEEDLMRKIHLFVCVCALALLQACATIQYDKPVAGFQKSVDESVAVIATYYQDLNAYERSIYLENAFLNPHKEVLFKDSHGQPTPLAGNIFSVKGIKARLDSLHLVSLYAKRLSDLAGSKVPAQFPENSKILGDNLANLADTFSSLNGTPDTTASSYIGPISSLVGLVGQIYLERQRDAALTKAITQGDPLIRKILALIEADLVNVVGPLRQTGEKELLADMVAYYNANRLKMSYAERRQSIDAIKSAAESYSAAVIFNPSSLVSGMADAHQALVKYAKSEKKPNDFGEFVEAMELFTARVDIVAGSVRKLQSIR
jgi:hypothetical protein